MISSRFMDDSLFEINEVDGRAFDEFQSHVSLA